MYLEKEHIGRFVGTGELNADGDNLSAFLEKYNPNKYLNPCSTVDTVVFAYKKDGDKCRVTKVLLIKRGNHPSIGWWAIPGGFVDFREDIELAALRELQEETGVADIEVCQLKCYGEYDRDPRTRIITTAYVALVEEGSVKDEAGDDASDSGWFEIEDVITEPAILVENTNNTEEMHRLTLTHPERGIKLWADVKITKREGSILPYQNYHVCDMDMIAADHGAIILEGYHFVCDKLQKM